MFLLISLTELVFLPKPRISIHPMFLLIVEAIDVSKKFIEFQYIPCFY